VLTLTPSGGDSGVFRLDSRYYLEEEKRMLTRSDSLATYKITSRYGMFHKTIARNISFGQKLDSIKLLTFSKDQIANIRGYFNVNSPTFGTDSIDVSVSLLQLQDEISIIRKPQ
jgi:hypothetical protein